MTDVTGILGREAASGSPDAIRRVAAQLDDIGTTASSIKGNLSALDAARWTGAAANLYREKQDNEIPGELSKISSSFGIASRALWAYADGLDEAIGQAQALARNYNVEQENLNSANRAEESALQYLNATRRAHAVATDPAARAQAESYVAAAARSYSGAVANRQAGEDTLRQLDQQRQYLCDVLSEDAAACASQLQEASAAGIHNSMLSWADRNIVDGVPGAIVSNAAGVVVNFGKATFELGKAEFELGLNPFDQQRWDHLASAYSDWVDAAKPIVEAVGICALVAAAVVIVACAPETIAGLIPTLSMIGATTTDVGIALDGSKSASDGYLVIRGERSGAAVVQDVVDTGFDVVGKKLDPGTDPQVADLRSSLDTYKETGTSQARGWITRRMTALQASELHSVFVVSSGTIVQTVIDDRLPSIERHVHALLGPVVIPRPAAVVGPFTSITQGPASRVRALCEPRPVAAGAFV